MKKFLFLGVLAMLLIFASCKKDDPVIVGDGFQGFPTFEYGGRTYAYAWFKNQGWMLENLAYLPSVSPATVGSDTNPLYYVYDYQGTNVAKAKATDYYYKYGVLYNWDAAKTACPPGWHLPSDKEWKLMEVFFGMDTTEVNATEERNSGDVGYQLKSTSGWLQDGSGENFSNGENSGNFTALPGGFRISDAGGVFNAEGYYGCFWTSSKFDIPTSWSRMLYYYGRGVHRNAWSRNWGLSIRCVKDPQ